MTTFLTVIHVITCFLMILVVLMQSGRGAGLSMFGGGGGEMFQTPTTTGFMKKLTSGLAITFAVTSLFLTLFSSRSELRSVTMQVGAPPPQAAPAPSAPPASAPTPEKKP